MSNRITILHITVDYPDSVNRNKTIAVQNLIKASRKFDHIVMSMNRFSLPRRNSISVQNNLYVLKYWGLPYGIGLKYFLDLVARSIERIIYKNNIVFDIIHAHNLTFAGIIGNYLAEKFSKPFVCSLRGSTDIKVIKYKPNYIELYKTIVRNCRRVFVIAPWAQKNLNNKLALNMDNKEVALPNIITGIKVTTDKVKISASNRFVTAFRLDFYKIKNIRNIIRAFDIAVSKLGDIHLDIFGSGSVGSKSKIVKMIDASQNSSRIHLLGEIRNGPLCSRLNSYAGLLHPSYPETFGMVYLEALLAGVPIIHSKNTGVDGYFTNGRFSFGVDHKSVEDISKAIIDVYLNQEEYKKNLIIALKNGEFDFFRTEAIVENYCEHIHESLCGLISPRYHDGRES